MLKVFIVVFLLGFTPVTISQSQSKTKTISWYAISNVEFKCGNTEGCTHHLDKNRCIIFTNSETTYKILGRLSKECFDKRDK